MNVPWHVFLIPLTFLYPTLPTLHWSNMKELIHPHSILSLSSLICTSNSTEYGTTFQGGPRFCGPAGGLPSSGAVASIRFCVPHCCVAA